MIDINWDIFCAKFSDNKQAAFQKLAYYLFCSKYGLSDGVRGYNNQVGIENEPVKIGNEYISYQAKYYDRSKVSNHKKDFIDCIKTSKTKNPDLARIIFYVFPELTESSILTEKKAEYEKEIDKVAEQLQVQIEWEDKSRLEIQLNKPENEEIAKYFFVYEETLLKEFSSRLKNIEADLSASLQIKLKEKSTNLQVNETHLLNCLKNESTDFNRIIPFFYNTASTQISREEVEELFSWITSPLGEKEKNLVLLTGKAGMGKSAVLKMLLNKLETANIPTLALKSDVKVLNPLSFENDFLGSGLSLTDGFDLLIKKQKSVVILIDQVDALSLSLSNDYERLKSYICLVDKFIREKYKKVKVVISCRKFDLEHDPSFFRFREAKQVELKELSIESVKQVLSKLVGEKISDQVSSTTLMLFQTPLHLELFCRIYSKRPDRYNYSTVQSLYQELWKLYIEQIDEKNKPVCPEELEMVLFKIADKIQKSETLSPQINFSAKGKKSIHYLSSNGLVLLEQSNNRISFFHQSFYNYVFARHFCLNDLDLCQILLGGHQGLFYRSTVKYVLTYLRNFDEEKYDQTLRGILYHQNIRYHIKLLVLELLALFQDLNNAEKIIANELQEKSPELFNAFVDLGLSAEWFDSIHQKLKQLLPKLDGGLTEENRALLFFIARQSSSRPEEVFLLVSQIRDKESQLFTAQRALWFTTDFSLPIVLEWYQKVKQEPGTRGDISILENAVNSNPSFVINELDAIFNQAMPFWRKAEKCKIIDEHHLFDFICEPLVKKSPIETYYCFKKIVTKLIEASQYSYSVDYLESDTAFGRFDPHFLKHHKLIDWIVEILQDQILDHLDFVRQEVIGMLSSNSETLFCMAFQIMNKAPDRFIDLFIDLFNNKLLIDDLLGYKDSEYYFREHLKDSVTYYSENQLKNLQKYIIDYLSPSDFIPDRQRPRRLDLAFPHFGWKQRKLIHSLPNGYLNEALIKKKKELDRRFKSEECANTKPNHHVSIGSSCGGLTSREKYMRFSDMQWYNSFIKCKDDKWRKGHSFPFSTYEHAKMFKEWVEQNPRKNYSFVESFVDDEKIHIRYKLSGLEGLIASNLDFDLLNTLYNRLLKKEILEREIFQLVEISGLLFKEGEHKYENIRSFLFEIIQKPYCTVYMSKLEEILPEEDKLELLNKGLNSIQGRAIEALIKSCKLTYLRESTYNQLIHIQKKLCVELRLVVLYELYHREYYDNNLFKALFGTYLENTVSDYLFSCQDIINTYLSEDPNFVLPYLRSVYLNPRAQNVVAPLLFLGWNYGNRECKELLDNLLQKDEVAVVQTIEAAAYNLMDDKIKENSIYIFNLFSMDERTEVKKAILHAFYQFEPTDFHSLIPVFDRLIPTLSGSDFHGVFHYFEKCASAFPEKCYFYLKQLIQLDSDNLKGNHVESGEAFQLLLAIYKRISVNRKSQLQNEIMDTFDQMLKDKQYNYNLNNILKEIDME